MGIARAALVAVILMGTACGDDADDVGGDDPPATADAAGEARSLTEFLDSAAVEDGTNVLVDTILFDDGDGVRMCEALAESFPPQCGGRSMMIANAEQLDVDWTEHDGVRWTDRPVPILGWVEQGAFIVT